MSNSGFPKVGVEFVADNAQQYEQVLSDIASGYQKMAVAMSQSGLSLKEISAAFRSEGLSARDTQTALQPLIKAENDARRAAIDAAKAAGEAADARDREAARARMAADTIRAANRPSTVPEATTPVGLGLNSKASLEDVKHAADQAGTSVGNLSSKFTSLSSSAGASRVGVGLLSREVLGLVGGTTAMTQAVESFIYATGPVGIGLAAIASAVVLAKEAGDQFVATYQKAQKAIVSAAGSAADATKALIELERARGNGARAYAGPDLAKIEQTRAGLEALIKVDVDRESASNKIILKNAEQGASLSELVDQITKAKLATGEITQAQLDNQDALVKILPTIVAAAELYRKLGLEARLAASAAGASGLVVGGVAQGNAADFQAAIAGRASDLASKLGRQILDLNRANNTQLQQLARDHNARMSEIAQDGADRRADIERNYAQRIIDINANLSQTETDALTDLAQRIADAEDNAAQERLDRAADYATRLVDIDVATTDKRLQIEQTYQDKLRAIQEQYDLSLFDAVAHRDAKALIQAGMQREKSIAEAQRTRQRELDAAQKQKDKDAENARIAYEKQMRDLEQALARQEARLRQEYERRIRDLEQNAQKQRDAAMQSRDRELQDQAEAQAKALAAENKGYKTRQDDLATALAERKQSLIDALTQEQDITERYAKAIVESLHGILAPDEIAALLNDVQSALSAEIDITIKPFVASGGGGGGAGRAYAYGGYTGGYSGPATLHPNEVILPLSNASRTAQLMNDYVMPRMNVPMGGRGGGAGSMGASGKVQVEVSLNGDMLNARIVSQTDGVITTLLTGARGRLRV